MPIPDYQTLMLPVLKLAGDGQEHRIADVVRRLADEFKLTEGEREHLLPSGRQPTFNNRVHWAKTYLSQAGLLATTRRAHFTITDRGRGVLQKAPPGINVEFLMQFAEFRDFRERDKAVSPKSQAAAAEGTTANAANAIPEAYPGAETPDELVRLTIKSIERALAKQLVERIIAAPPAFFEGLIVELLVAMGYGGSREGAGRALGKSGDGGVDGVIDQDALGLDRVYVQAKRYKPEVPVDVKDVRAFSGSLGEFKASKGVFVTTSYFTKPAYEFAERHPHRLVLLNGDDLATLMIRHNIGVRTEDTLHLKKIDEDFFEED
jgi:restriction system protein